MFGVEVYAEPFKRRHYAGLLDAAVLFRVFNMALALGLSLVVAFSTGGFWTKVVPVYAQPTVNYTGDALLLFQGDEPSQSRIWSTSALLNKQFPERLIPATIQVAQEDLNNDGSPDVISFISEVQSSTPVTSVQVLLQFQYKIDTDPVMMDMYCLAYLAASSATPGGVLYVEGDLELSQRTPLQSNSYNGYYNSLIIGAAPNSTNSTLEAAQASLFNFEAIIAAYMSRNFTTAYTNQYQVWKAGPGDTFQLNMRVHIPPNQLVWYRPRVVENLKYGWIQYLATYITFWWGLTWLESFIFRGKIFQTRGLSDTQPSMQRF